MRACCCAPQAQRHLSLKPDYSSELRQRAWKIRTPGIRLGGSALVGDRPFSEVGTTAEALTEPIPKDYAPPAPLADGSGADSCGLVIVLYTEAALRRCDAGADLFSFWRTLLDESGDDGYTQALYLATLAALSGEPKAAAWLAHFADHRAEDRADLSTAFARVGVSLPGGAGNPGE